MSTATEIEARKARAVALLTEWLRDDDPIFDLLDEIREAVVHVIDCDGKDRSCGYTTDDCTGDEKCEHCPPGECGDCESYKNGNGVNIWRTRPTLELINELSMRLKRREEERAS